MSETPHEASGELRGLRAIALDGGTTNTRARLIRDGRIVATARRQVGVRDEALVGGAGSGAIRLVDAVRGAIEEVAGAEGAGPPDLIVAAGMLSSELGLLAVPHVEAPAGIDELSEALVVRPIPAVASLPIAFIPGVRTPGAEGPEGWMWADVMRGEECETLGAVAELTRRGALNPGQEGLAFVWPGSHTKVVALDRRGRIAGSQTSLAGELLQAVARHTLLSASVPAELPERMEPSAVAAGGRAAEEQGLGRAAFLVRIAALAGALDAAKRAAFWISAVVADDARALARHPILADAGWVGVGGREPLRSLYADALARRIAAHVSRLEDEVCERSSATGALAIAASWLRRQGGPGFSSR
jgi:2-dehydro-3-deoxygalactonokinase